MEMEKTNQEIGERNAACPTREELSAWVDGEAGTASAEITAHVEKCARCREKAALYRQLGEIIHGRTEEGIPEGLADRIKAAIRQPAQETRRGWSLLSAGVGGLLFRAAAVVAVAGSVVFYMVQQSPQVNQPAVTVIRAPATQERAPVVAQTEPAANSYQRPFDGVAGSNSIPLESMIGASYGDIPQPVFTEAAGNAPVMKRQPVVIADQVRQVWTAAKLDEAEKILTGFNNRTAKAGRRLHWEMQDGHLMLEAIMSKAELVQLVRECRAAGLELMSPAAPQPEQNLFLGRGSDPVHYQAEIMTDGR